MCDWNKQFSIFIPHWEHFLHPEITPLESIHIYQQNFPQCILFLFKFSVFDTKLMLNFNLLIFIMIKFWKLDNMLEENKILMIIVVLYIYSLNTYDFFKKSISWGKINLITCVLKILHAKLILSFKII